MDTIKWDPRIRWTLFGLGFRGEGTGRSGGRDASTGRPAGERNGRRWRRSGPAGTPCSRGPPARRIERHGAGQKTATGPVLPPLEYAADRDDPTASRRHHAHRVGVGRPPCPHRGLPAGNACRDDLGNTNGRLPGAPDPSGASARGGCQRPLPPPEYGQSYDGNDPRRQPEAKRHRVCDQWRARLHGRRPLAMDPVSKRDSGRPIGSWGSGHLRLQQVLHERWGAETVGYADQGDVRGGYRVGGRVAAVSHRPPPRRRLRRALLSVNPAHERCRRPPVNGCGRIGWIGRIGLVSAGMRTLRIRPARGGVRGQRRRGRRTSRKRQRDDTAVTTSGRGSGAGSWVRPPGREKTAGTQGKGGGPSPPGGAEEGSAPESRDRPTASEGTGRYR